MNLQRTALLLSSAATALSLSLAAAPARAEALATATSSTTSTDTDVAQAGTVVDYLVNSGDYDTLVSLVQLAGLADTLMGPGPFTVFAPTDAAFAELDPAVVDALTDPANRDVLADVLKYHVLPASVPASDIGNESLGTLYGSVPARVSGGMVMVGPATVTDPDIMATNGIVHEIDSVLVPGDTVSRLFAPMTFPVTW